MNLSKLITTVTLCMASALASAAPYLVLENGVIIGVNDVLVNGDLYHGRFHDENAEAFLVPENQVDQLTGGLFSALETHYANSQYVTGDILGCQTGYCEMVTIYAKYFNEEKNRDHYLGVQVDISDNPDGKGIHYDPYDRRTNGQALTNTFTEWQLTEEGDGEGDGEEGEVLSCQMPGSSYGYVYTGTSYQQDSHVSLTETGSFMINNEGNLSGESTLAYNYSNYNGTGQPLWLLLHQVQSSGVITQDVNTCTGSIESSVTATVIKTSNSGLVPEGAILFADMPKSDAYTISGSEKSIVDLVSTSPGTVASGKANKQ